MTYRDPNVDPEFARLQAWLGSHNAEQRQAEAELAARGNRALRILAGILVIVGLLYLLAWTQVARAATVTWPIKITLPATGCTVDPVTGLKITPCDNSPLTGQAALTGAEIFVSLSPIADQPSGVPTHVLWPLVTTVTSTVTANNGDTIYARARVRTATQVSSLGAQIAKKVDLPVIPGAPLLTADTVGYQLNLGTNNKITLTRVASVPIDKPCQASSVTDPFRTVNLLADRNWAVMDPNPAKPGQFFTRPRQVWAKCEAT